ncbi:unnamed protein product, partial [Ixodes hexagonus]
QVFDKELDCLLDYDSQTILEDKGKILVIGKKKSESEPEQACIVVSASSGEERLKNMNPDLKYVLPHLPLDISNSLYIQKEKGCVTDSLRRRIIQWVYHHLCQYSLYPGKLYTEASLQLAVKHAVLRDRIGTGYDPWQRSLRFKAKYERRKLEGEGVLHNRVKYARTKPAVNVSDLRRCNRELTVYMAIFSHDQHSIAGMIETMKKEMKITVPDTNLLNDAMERTFNARREMVKQGHAITEIIETYPALALADQVFAEIHRITGLNAIERFVEVATENLSSVLELTEGKPRPALFDDVMAHLEDAEGLENKELECVNFLCLLPLLLKETHTSFFK